MWQKLQNRSKTAKPALINLWGWDLRLFVLGLARKQTSTHEIAAFIWDKNYYIYTDQK